MSWYSDVVIVPVMLPFVLGFAGIAGGLLLTLAGQAVWARARTRKLPEARGPDGGTLGSGSPTLRLLVLGESTVAGVGAPGQLDGLAGRCAAALAELAGGTVIWRAVGRSGFTAREVRQVLVPRLSGMRADIVVVALGVNDTTRLRRTAEWVSDLSGLLLAVRETVGPAVAVVAGVPPIGRFPALPQPLRAVLGWRARRLDRAAARWVARQDGVAHVPTMVSGAEDFAVDGYHPGPGGYAKWGRALAEAAVGERERSGRSARLAG